MEHILPLELETSDGKRDCKRHVHECKQQLVMKLFLNGTMPLDALFVFSSKGHEAMSPSTRI